MADVTLSFVGPDQRLALQAAKRAEDAAGGVPGNIDELIAERIDPKVGEANDAADLAGRYANANTDADIPGAAPGERGARYWASLVSAIFTRKVTTGKWVWVQRDRYGRLLDGSINRETGLYAPTFTKRLLANLPTITIGPAKVSARIGARFLSAERDRYGRLLGGWDGVLRGRYIPKLLRPGGGDVYAQIDKALADAASAKAGVNPRIGQLRALHYRSVKPRAATIPKITQTSNSTPTITTGSTLPYTDARLTWAHGVSVQNNPGGGAPFNTANINGWITAPGAPRSAGSAWSLRFLTDSPVFEVQVGDWNGASSWAIEVDGERLAPATVAQFTNAGGNRYLRVDFSDDVQSFVTGPTIAAGGSGYAIGDELTVVGGTNNGRPLIAVVTGLGASGAVSTVYVKDFGAYTAFPAAGAATTTNGAGTGATLTLSGTAYSGHTTRRARRVEIWNSSGKTVGLRVPPLATVQPWPVAGPRLFAITDSYGDTFAFYPGGGYPFRIGQRLGIEDVWVNGRGGTGFLATNNNTQSTFRQRLQDMSYVMPANPLTPVILFVQASINDSPSTAVDLQAEVLAFWTEAFTTAAYANVYFVQTGILRSSGSTPADDRNAAVKAGFEAAQALYDPLKKRSTFVETRGAAFDLLTVGGKSGATTGAGNTDFYNASDGAHPTQDGHDFLGDLFAMRLLAAIQSWS
ncbi:SGNH/GDSL hydrolase family protein [uncultured Sphingomonas sp.]|uniref:SGNH/GDSL hydrolase family protein n=1 Tax=uncultured Sphingomonas sp. TaxID=158754 RepID=UPI0025EDE411|nr:SGNH/GDSL hydrolase family protein [uncultured Sphingomonas sp.]